MHTSLSSHYKSPRTTWLHAGAKASPEHLASSRVDFGNPIVTINNETYSVNRGYYIPHYGVGATTPSSKQTAVLEQKKRLFYFAERGIDVVDSHEDIMRDHAEWLKTSNPRERRVLGGLVVGAMVNRTARVEQAILMRRAGGLSLGDALSEQGDLLDSDIATLKAQLKQYATILMSDKSLVQCVYREDRRFDRDGLLADIIRETFKAYLQPSGVMVKGTVDKIGDCMSAIDEAAVITRKLLDSLSHHPNLKGFMAAHGERLRATFDAFVESARARSGIKSSDSHYSDIHKEFTIIGEDMFEQISAIREAARGYDGRGNTVLLTGLKLVSNGAKLVDNMAQARYPFNALAFPGVERSEREPTSVELFKEKTERFMERRGSTPAR